MGCRTLFILEFTHDRHLTNADSFLVIERVTVGLAYNCANLVTR